MSIYISEKAVPLMVTTRQAGFGTVEFVNSLITNKHTAGFYNGEKGLMEKYYRVTLALMEAKFVDIQRSLTKTCRVDYNREYKDDIDFIWVCKSVTHYPEILANLINGLGIHKKTWFTTTAPDQYDKDGVFLPLPEQVVLSNLRKVVERLSDPETPQEVRVHFRRHNPIPGTIWDANSVLQNPNDIINKDYKKRDLVNDISTVRSHYSSPKVPNKLIFKINWDDSSVGKEVFISCKLKDMKVTERKSEESWLDYSKGASVEGDISSFSMNDNRFYQEQLNKGIRNLLGEVPSKHSSVAHYYSPRNKYSLRCHTALSYKCCVMWCHNKQMGYI